MGIMTINALRDWAIDRDAPEPLWVQLATILRSVISEGSLQEDAALPSEAELINFLGVSRTVVREALAELVREGLVYKIRAKGTFVAPKLPELHFIGAVSGSAYDLRASGQRISTRVLRQEAGTATPAEASALQIDSDSAVVRLRRLRSVGGSPLLLVDTTLPADMVPGLTKAKLENRSLYEHLRRHYAIEPAGADRWLQAVLPNAEQSDLLGLDTHTPLLSIESVAWGADGVRFEWYRALHRSEKSRFYIGIR
jgi:GntR family transcriptional regulator